MSQSIIVTLICTTALGVPIIKLIQLNKQIKKCWPSIKCTALGQLLQPIFGPSNVSMIENSENCMASAFSSMFDSNISATNSNVSTLSTITSSLTDSVNGIRTQIAALQQSLYDSLESIAQQIFNAYGRIAQLVLVITTIVNKVVAIFYRLLLLIQAIYATVGSTWNGPIGGSARYFAGLVGV